MTDQPEAQKPNSENPVTNVGGGNNVAGSNGESVLDTFKQLHSFLVHHPSICTYLCSELALDLDAFRVHATDEPVWRKPDRQDAIRALLIWISQRKQYDRLLRRLQIRYQLELKQNGLDFDTSGQRRFDIEETAYDPVRIIGVENSLGDDQEVTLQSEQNGSNNSNKDTPIPIAHYMLIPKNGTF